jgi:hypothetical protein
LALALFVLTATIASNVQAITVTGSLVKWDNGQKTSGDNITIVVGPNLWIEVKGGRDIIHGSVITKTATNQSGNFTLDLPPGKYMIAYWRQGYIPQTDSFAVPTNGPITGGLGRDTQPGSAGHSVLDFDNPPGGNSTSSPNVTPPSNVTPTGGNSTKKWNLTGKYVIKHEWQNVFYPHDCELTGNNSGKGGHPAGGPYDFTWHIAGSVPPVPGQDFHWVIVYDTGAVGTTMHMVGTVQPDGTLKGTWWDDYQGQRRDGSWSTTSGKAKPLQ